MTDAIAMALLLRDFLVEAHAFDSGALYQIIVTDTAGNAVELKWHDKRWILADSVDLTRLMGRLRLVGSA